MCGCGRKNGKKRIKAEGTENTEFAEKRKAGDKRWTVRGKAGGLPDQVGVNSRPPLQKERASLGELGRFGWVELHGADDAFAFFDEDHLIRLEVFERFDEAAGPADFE